MPWQEQSLMSQREEFVAMCRRPGVCVAEACRRYGISRKTGYKWIARARAGQPLADWSPRPHNSPDDLVRMVGDCGRVSFLGRHLRVPKAFIGCRVALRPTNCDGVYELRYRHSRVGAADLRTAHPRVVLRGRSAPTEDDPWV